MTYYQIRHDQFTELFVKNQARVYRYIVTLVSNPADADELFQETSLTLWKRWDSFDQGRDFLPWAYGIALNHVRNFWRRRKDMPTVFDDDILHKLTQLRLQDDQEMQRRQVALLACIEKLKPHQKEAIERYYSTSATIKVIAESDNRKLKATYKMLERIRAMLYECISRKVTAEA